jgi:transposase-like protein
MMIPAPLEDLKRDKCPDCGRSALHVLGVDGKPDRYMCWSLDCKRVWVDATELVAWVEARP